MLKDIHNTVANAILRLDSGAIQDNKADWMTFTICWCHYTILAKSAENTDNHQEQLNIVFANFSEEDVIYPQTGKEILQAQKNDANASLN